MSASLKQYAFRVGRPVLQGEIGGFGNIKCGVVTEVIPAWHGDYEFTLVLDGLIDWYAVSAKNGWINYEKFVLQYVLALKMGSDKCFQFAGVTLRNRIPDFRSAGMKIIVRSQVIILAMPGKRSTSRAYVDIRSIHSKYDWFRGQ